MATLTTVELLRDLSTVCYECELVESYTIKEMDEDILSVRVSLMDGSFIEVFHNIRTAKVAFAWIKGGKRIYGKDNAKRGWHVHPFDNPEGHHACQPVNFKGFLREVEDFFVPPEGTPILGKERRL
jgi:hypothetical protein